jgi:hypothetical protein
LDLIGAEKVPTGGPGGKIGSDESEGDAGTGVALYNRPLPVRSGKKILW